MCVICISPHPKNIQELNEAIGLKIIAISTFLLIDFEGMTFLETEQGKPFVSVFRHLRLQYIISDLASAKIIEQDSLVPSGKRV